MDCRNRRAGVRIERIRLNGGLHSNSEWKILLEKCPVCAVCERPWSVIPSRPDPRYKQTWTKGHIVSIYHGGENCISNIQAECYECNFRKNSGVLARSVFEAATAASMGIEEELMGVLKERFSKEFSFILNNGVEVFPVQMKRRDTGKIAFRISPGGVNGNTLAASEEVDEGTMVRKVLTEGYAVRCKSLNTYTQGLYKQGHRSVAEVRLLEPAVLD